MYCVYKHYDIKNKCRYVGLSQANKGYYARAYETRATHRSAGWLAVFSEYNPIVEITHEVSTREEAMRLEREEILKEFKNNSPLVNILKGDCRLLEAYDEDARKHLATRTGSIGYWRGKKRTELMQRLVKSAHTPEANAKRAAIMRGRKLTDEHKKRIGQGLIGKRLGWNPSEETRKKMSLSHIGKPTAPKSPEGLERLRQLGLNRKNSPETRAKISKSHENRTYKSRKVICVETGEVFSGAKEASEKKHANMKHVQACCVGRRKRTGGYHWKYEDLEFS